METIKENGTLDLTRARAHVDSLLSNPRKTFEDVYSEDELEERDEAFVDLRDRTNEVKSEFDEIRRERESYEEMRPSYEFCNGFSEDRAEDIAELEDLALSEGLIIDDADGVWEFRETGDGRVRGWVDVYSINRDLETAGPDGRTRAMTKAQALVALSHYVADWLDTYESECLHYAAYLDYSDLADHWACEERFDVESREEIDHLIDLALAS